MIMEPGADGPEWSVEQQRSGRIGRPDEVLAQDMTPPRRRHVRWLALAGIPLLAAAAIGSWWRASMASILAYAFCAAFTRTNDKGRIAALVYLNDGKLNCGGTPMRVLIIHCCAIDKMLLVIQ